MCWTWGCSFTCCHGFVLLLSYGVSRPRQEAFLLTRLDFGLSREHRTGVLQGVSATRLMGIGWWDRPGLRGGWEITEQWSGLGSL